MSTTTATATKKFGFIGRCPVKGCACIMRIDAPGKLQERWTRGTPGVAGTAQKYFVTVAAWMPYTLHIACTRHRYELTWREIEGVHNPDHACDSRCMNARGHNCECSCGGENHGASYRI